MAGRRSDLAGVAALVGWMGIVGCEEPSSDREDQLRARPVNPTCVARPRPLGDADVTLQRVFGQLSASRLVALVQPPGGGPFYAVEQGGRIQRLLPSGASAATVDLSARVDATAQESGLLGLAFHPDFPARRQAYVSYTARVGARLQSRLAAFEVDGNGDIVPASERVLLRVEQPFDNHNGGHVAFGPDGYLYFGLGDGGDAGDPLGTGQDPDQWLGKLLRIDVDRGAPYAIPPDNPYAQGGGRPEIYALGLRNPWRFSFDSVTGALWLGDVGQDRFEEIDRIERGGNYGWNAREAQACFGPGCDRNDLIDPVLVYDHAAGRSVTGGYVVRDPALPSLSGVYVFGDYVSGTVWGAFEDPVTGALERRTLVDGFGLAISSFARGADGAVYVLHHGPDDAAVYRIVADQAVADPFPERLSDTGCFTATDPRTPLPGLVPYEVNVSLWSDRAAKRRWIALPDDASIDVNDDGSWDLPIGTVLIKAFERDGRRLETRLLMRHDDGNWAGYTYAWNDAQTEAFLTQGETVVPTPSGPWAVPSRGQCMQCHTDAAGRVLGFRPDQLARDVVVEGAPVDQLDRLEALELFSSSLAPSRAIDPLPALASAAPLDARARAYLDVNCSHCHRPGGPGRGTFDLRYATPASAQGWCNAPPVAGGLGLPDPVVVAPGEPDRSLLLVRSQTRALGQMPPLATAEVDPTGSSLVRQWIAQMQDCPGDWRRTVVFLERRTDPGENLFFRGGLDPTLAAEAGIDCRDDARRCAIPIRHRVPGIGTGDNTLDWFGAEPAQDAQAIGSPSVWTTDAWPSGWGPPRSVAVDGFGTSPLNVWGPHHWMLDVEMDCSRTADGWFEIKAFEAGGAGWEPDVTQSGTPRRTRNHWARCGAVQRFAWGTGAVDFGELDP